MKKITTVLFAAVFALLGADRAVAAPRTASVTGNWSDMATWGGLSVPGAADAVTINSNVIVTVDTTASCTSIVIAAANAVNGITIGGTQSLTVFGALTTTIPGADNRHTTIAVGAGSLSAASIALTGGGTVSRYTDLTISSGSVTVPGSITAGGIASLVTFTGPGTLNVGGTFINASAGFTSATGSTVIYSGVAQTVKVATYGNLTLSGSGVKTLTSISVINGTLSMEGTATASAAPTYGAAATLQYNTASARTNGLEWITPFVASGGVVITNTGTVTLNAAKVFNATAPLAVKSGATLASGNFKLTLGGAFGNSGTFVPGTGTVEWNAAGPQTVAACDYNNLILSGSGAKALIAGTTVAGTLSIAPTGSATASVGDGLNLGVGSLTLGVLARINGTWGSTSAAGATYQNNVFFSPTTGYLTVATDARGTPTVTNWPAASSITTNQTLGASVLTGGAATNAAGVAVPGSFAFDTPSFSPPAGTYSAAVTFTPTDLTSYKTVGGSVNVAVATISYYHVAAGGSATSPYDTWGKAATDIQTAVNKASADLVPGTTECVVLVTNDTYTLTSQILITNGITLRGFGGRDATFINGNYPASTNRCIEIRNTPTMATVDGFTISNGYAFIQSAGGGIFVTNSPAALLNCAVISNRASFSAAGLGYGAGIGVIATNYLLMSNVLVSANVLMNNAGVGGGAALYCVSAPGLIVDCQFVNHATSGNITGGGVILSGGSPRMTMLRCLIQNNYSDRYTGGINVAGFALLDSCTIDNNSTRSGSGGLKIDSDAVIVTNCVISRNRAGGEGVGGVSFSRGFMANCQIVSNYTSGYGGGIVGDRTMRNCLIAANRADGIGGGVYRSATAGITTPMVNCTIVRNESGSYGGGMYNASPNSNIFINVIVADNQAAGSGDNLEGILNRTNFVYSCSPLLGAGEYGNITADPLFAAAGSGYGTNAMLGDYRLRIGSPAIDAGTAAGAPSIDLDNNSRPRDGDGNGLAAFDMGAYEAGSDGTGGVFRCSFSAPTNRALDSLDAVFTAYAAGPNTNGLSYFWAFGDGATSDWSSATRVIAHSYSGYGSYTVTLSVSNELGQTASYSRAPFITVYPSYVYVSTNGGSVSPYGSWGTAASNIQDAVDVAAAGEGYTIAVLVSNGTYTVTNEIAIPKSVSLRGISGNWNDAIIRGGYPASTNRCLNITGAGALVDGFTITNGYQTLHVPAGGVYLTAGTMRNCLIIGNYTYGQANLGGGGGVFVGTAGVLTNCEIRNNEVSVDGGGVHTIGTVVDTLVVGNTAGSGGGVRIGGGTVDRCVVIGNTALDAASGGGGVAKANSGGAIVRNCLIAGNYARNVGGGFYMSAGSSFDLQNCTIVGNTATNGGGVYMSSSNHLGVNCIVNSNKGTRPGATNDISGASWVMFANSCSPDLTAGVTNNITASPAFTKSGSGYGLSLVRGNYHLQPGSPCVDTGSNQAWMATALDLDGLSRVLGAGPNMGAYEKTLMSGGTLLIIR